MSDFSMYDMDALCESCRNNDNECECDPEKLCHGYEPSKYDEAAETGKREGS